MMPEYKTDRTPYTQNQNRIPPDHIGMMLASLIMMGMGWFGLFQLVSTKLPRLGGEMWLFFLLLQIAVTGTALPIVRYLNLRFTKVRSQELTSGVIVRQSVWVGLFFVTCAWLQIPRALSAPMIFFVALVYVVVEVFLRTRELSSEGL